MKALTVQQPWAWAIVHGGKDVENRTQAWSYRGPLAIHAGARWSERGADSWLIEDTWAKTASYPPAAYYFEFGSIIGLVDLVDVHMAEPTTCSCEGDDAVNVHQLRCTTLRSACAVCMSPWAEASYAEHGGRRRRDIVHLVLANPRPLATPVPCKGRLGLWTPSVADVEEIQLEVIRGAQR